MAWHDCYTWQKMWPQLVLTGDSRISLQMEQNASTVAVPEEPEAAPPAAVESATRSCPPEHAYHTQMSHTAGTAGA